MILKANGQPIIESGDLPALVDKASPGERMTLELWREGKPTQLTAQLGTVRDAAQAPAAAAPEPSAGPLGLSVRPLTAQERRDAAVSAGLLVEEASGAAANAGIESGDIVIAVNGVPVEGVAALQGLVRKAGSTVALLVQRGSDALYVPVPRR